MQNCRDGKIPHGDPHFWGGDGFQFGGDGAGMGIDSLTRNGYGVGMGFILLTPPRPA